MINISAIQTVKGPEMVERKGSGHPDSICDHIAEAISADLCKYYIETCGIILHHNVDKALLVGGTASPAFGSGHIDRQMELYIAGRATAVYEGKTLHVHDVAEAAARQWLSSHLRFVDAQKDIRIIPKIRPGSNDLVTLFQRFGKGDVPLSNDTSFGVGNYPYSKLEMQVISIERLLNHPDTKAQMPFIGEDIKVMGVQSSEPAVFTISIAMVGRFIADMADYRQKIEQVKVYLANALSLEVDRMAINTADDYQTGSVFLTVSGCSAENGDDG